MRRIALLRHIQRIRRSSLVRSGGNAVQHPAPGQESSPLTVEYASGSLSLRGRCIDRQGLSAGRGEWISEALAREVKANGPAARMRLLAQLLATEQMDDVLAALKYLQTQPYVDAARIAVVGNSFGGILAVFSAERATGIRAVVASAPAAQTWARAPELQERLLLAARNARVPMYLFQAANDFDLSPTEKLAEEMARVGKPHTRKIFPAFGNLADGGT
jgi:carboxymethylenebutenolidase